MIQTEDKSLKSAFNYRGWAFLVEVHAKYPLCTNSANPFLLIYQVCCKILTMGSLDSVQVDQCQWCFCKYFLEIFFPISSFKLRLNNLVYKIICLQFSWHEILPVQSSLRTVLLQAELTDTFFLILMQPIQILALQGLYATAIFSHLLT